MWTHSWKGVVLGLTAATIIYLGVQFLTAEPVQVVEEESLLPDYLDDSERNTIQLFENVAPSVVSITAITVQRDYLSMNYTAIPQGSGSGFVWDHRVILSPIFMWLDVLMLYE